MVTINNNDVNDYDAVQYGVCASSCSAGSVAFRPLTESSELVSRVHHEGSLTVVSKWAAVVMSFLSFFF